ncbi:MAG: DUF3987 domain-containing protein [Synechococcaceae cyanobacterium RL_1_2]|nr:DUF3987 domain-containing protein [Synechococcaceae cyanobacterium RL_1_2]
MAPLNQLQEVIDQRFAEQETEYKQQLAHWENQKKNERGEKPEKPIPPREFYLSDFTMEALGEVIKHHPDCGLVYVSDELRYFFESMDMYRGGKGAIAPNG